MDHFHAASRERSNKLTASELLASSLKKQSMSVLTAGNDKLNLPDRLLGTELSLSSRGRMTLGVEIIF
jgi:hypothetical protein